MNNSEKKFDETNLVSFNLLNFEIKKLYFFITSFNISHLP